MSPRQTKDQLFEQVARIGKAVSSPKRLELLEILAQGEKTVETLAAVAQIDIRLASAHLRVLKAACLVLATRDGRHIRYRLAGEDVSALWVNLRSVAEAHLAELARTLQNLIAATEKLTAQSRATLLERAARGDIVVIDVRPFSEYRAGHLPHARSIPLSELPGRLDELPTDRDIIAYCRGPFCMMSTEAVGLLRAAGRQAHKIADGTPEWQAAGLPLAETL
jgi:rhodanese-related sulfurtransferase